MAYKYLVIVESPAKAKTIEKYLGRNYKVMASVGHIRDLPKSKMGIDFENNYEPHYISIRGKGDVIKSLKAAAKKAQKVYLAFSVPTWVGSERKKSGGLQLNHKRCSQSSL